MAAQPKIASYYACERQDLVAQLPRPLGRVLDVGCGSGGVGRSARAAGAASVTGIELVPEAAAQAAESYDAVHVGSAEAILPELEGPFDTLLAYDVLEHLVDPWAALRRLFELAAPGAHLHVSTPNARHLSLVYDLVVRGTFGYTDWGHRDNTHLRWFTPADLRQALGEAGWQPIAHSHTEIAAWRRALGRVTGGRSTEFLAFQWHYLARRLDRIP